MSIEDDQKTISKMLNDYNDKFHIFKDKDGKTKIKYIIEDTRKIRFIEVADGLIKKDIFDDTNKPKRKVGRPKKIKIMDPAEPEQPPKPKRKPGRPKSIDIDIKEGENRKNKVCVKYLKDRYKVDEKFREKCKQNRRDIYMRNKIQKKILEEQTKQIRENLERQDEKNNI